MPFTRSTAPLSLGIALLLLAGLPPAVHAQEGFVVIANVGNPVTTLQRQDVLQFFLRQRIRWQHGERVEPIDQVESSPVRRRFSNAVLAMDVPSVKGFWQESVFSGKADPPAERASDGEIVAFVKTHVHAIGYVGSVSALDGVKIIVVTP
jgi:ABC-type phosphate transport system substrate-binding protein